MTRCLIRPATLRDMTYIAANMREADRREISVQFPTWSPTWLGALAMSATWKWTASVGDVPVAALGFTHLNSVTVMGWSFGTKRYVRAVPEMLRFVPTALQSLESGGIRRIEVRSDVRHVQATRLIERMGGRIVAKLPQYGVNGEDFWLWERLL
jgi:RimJ/RimL family protein N-acetyltransferase